MARPTASAGVMLGSDIDATTSEDVIAGVIAKLNQFYVFPDTAKRMEQAFVTI